MAVHTVVAVVSLPLDDRGVIVIALQVVGNPVEYCTVVEVVPVSAVLPRNSEVPSMHHKRAVRYDPVCIATRPVRSDAPLGSLLFRQLEARVYPVWVLAQTSIAIVGVINQEEADDGQHHAGIDEQESQREGSLVVEPWNKVVANSMSLDKGPPAEHRLACCAESLTSEI